MKFRLCADRPIISVNHIRDIYLYISSQSFELVWNWRQSQATVIYFYFILNVESFSANGMLFGNGREELVDLSAIAQQLNTDSESLIAIKLTKAHPLDSLRLRVFHFHFSFPFVCQSHFIRSFIFFHHFQFAKMNERQQSQFHYSDSFLHLLFDRECEYCQYAMYGNFISLTGKGNGRKWYSHNVSLHITQLQEVKALSICLKLQNVITR